MIVFGGLLEGSQQVDPRGLISHHHSNFTNEFQFLHEGVSVNTCI